MCYHCFSKAHPLNFIYSTSAKYKPDIFDSTGAEAKVKIATTAASILLWTSRNFAEVKFKRVSNRFCLFSHKSRSTCSYVLHLTYGFELAACCSRNIHCQRPLCVAVKVFLKLSIGEYVRMR